MDLTVLKELNDVLEKLTHSGEPHLDTVLMKRIKTLCKSSESVVRTVYDILLNYMSKNHSEIRLSSFQVCNELYQRSHSFRELVTNNFQKIITLVCGVESHMPLPPPKQAAEKLKKISLLAIKNWTTKYGPGYPKLKLGYQYLKDKKKVDFDSLIAATEGERRQRQERERRNKVLLAQRLREVKTEYTEQVIEIQTCIKEMESCFEILMPLFDIQQSDSHTTGDMRMEHHYTRQYSSSSSSISLDDNDIADQNRTGSDQNRTEDNDSDSDVEWEDVVNYGDNGDRGEFSAHDVSDKGEFGAHGMIGNNWNVTIEIPETINIYQTEHNESLVDILKERYKLLTQKYLKNINKWMEWFTKGDEETLLKETIDVKSLIISTCNKYNELNITTTDTTNTATDTTNTDTDTTTNTSTRLSPIRENSGLFSSYEMAGNTNDMMNDPTTPQAQLATAVTMVTTTKSGHTSSRSEDVPVIPFDVDLINWTNTKLPAPTVASIGSLNQFWCEDKDVVISEDHKQGLNCRVISFPGEFKPIERQCCAPLSNGSLCTRQDRYKCPFHGPIIVRDEHGIPVISCQPSLYNRKDKKKKRKQKTIKYPGLTDLKKLKDLPKKRIEEKIFNKRTLRRIGCKMDSFDGKMKIDKFSDNFNYALKQ